MKSWAGSDLYAGGAKSAEDVLNLGSANAESFPNLRAGSGADHVNVTILGPYMCSRDTEAIFLCCTGRLPDLHLHPHQNTRWDRTDSTIFACYYTRLESWSRLGKEPGKREA